MGRFVSIFFAWILLISCNDDLPVGLYGYQVQNLLVGDSIKVWQNLSEDGNLPQFYTITSDEDDIRVIGYNQVDDTLFDETGRISTFEIFFTDSIVFSDSYFWRIKSLRNSNLEFVAIFTDNSVSASFILVDSK
jgi:hypothetical protein